MCSQSRSNIGPRSCSRRTSPSAAGHRRKFCPGSAGVSRTGCRADGKPLLQRLEQQYAGQVRFCEVDVESNLFLSQKYDISQYPTLVVFRAGEEQDRLVGTSQLATLARRLDEVLNRLK
ncbi:thioredoxin family protein [Blastopirellula sp. J2-11]|uniref:thioredoxin family protein n=1 Tax=Blastopirellula sp. J2-11 TaxID=2943192 RepID=UPI0039676E94